MADWDKRVPGWVNGAPVCEAYPLPVTPTIDLDNAETVRAIRDAAYERRQAALYVADDGGAAERHREALLALELAADNVLARLL